MGQAITVTIAPSANKNTLIFHLDRSLTGMEILSFDARTEIEESNNPAKNAAIKLIALGASTVTVYSNVVTITADESRIQSKKSEMINALENLYIHYSENLV